MKSLDSRHGAAMLRADEYKQPGDTCPIGGAPSPSSTYSLKRRQKGQSLVEFAMVVPFLLLVLVGTIELGRAYYYYNTLSKAVREGARYVSGHPYDSTTELPNAKKMVVYGNSGGSGNTVLPNLTTGMVTIAPRGGAGPYDMTNPPLWVKVSVSYPYTSVIAGLITLNLNFTPAVEMRYVDLNAVSDPP
jgi:Flp pilus assembly protein TadG